jgi:hypothetical protein
MQDKLHDDPPSEYPDIHLGIYKDQTEQTQSISDRVARDGYCFEGWNMDINTWDKINVPEGFSQLPLEHTTDGREPGGIIIWDPKIADVKHLTFDTYKGLQPKDAATAARLEAEGWKLVDSGRHIEGKYEERYYFKRNTPPDVESQQP